MASQVQPAAAPRADVRTIVGGGIKLGALTAAAVFVFAMLSRTLPAGGLENWVHFEYIVIAALLAAYLPAFWVRPADVDSIAWAALLGFLGAVVFTVLDVVLLRPLNVYHWTWDAIGGGSGFWYISVWWMGSAVLAWLGSWVYAAGRPGGGFAAVLLALQTFVLAHVLLAVVSLTGLFGVQGAVGGLVAALGLVVHVPLAPVLARR